MRYALIKNNKVENVIVADEEFVKRLASKYDYIENVDGKRVGPKYSYDPVKKVFGDPSPPPLPSLGKMKVSKLAQIETTFQSKVKQPIVDSINNCSWPGGNESTLLIDRAVRLAQQKKAITVNLYDTTGKAHTLSIVDAQKVLTLVADTFYALYAKKMAIAMQTKDAATIDDVKKVINDNNDWFIKEATK